MSMCSRLVYRLCGIAPTVYRTMSCCFVAQMRPGCWQSLSLGSWLRLVLPLCGVEGKTHARLGVPMPEAAKAYAAKTHWQHWRR